MLSKNEIHIENLKQRKNIGKLWHSIFLLSTVFSVLALSILIISIIDSSFGVVVVGLKYDPDVISPGKDIDDLPKDRLIELLKEYSLIDTDFTEAMLENIIRDKKLEYRSKTDLYTIFVENILMPDVIESYNLLESFTHKADIQETVELYKDDFPVVKTQFRSWLNGDILVRPQST